MKWICIVKLLFYTQVHSYFIALQCPTKEGKDGVSAWCLVYFFFAKTTARKCLPRITSQFYIVWMAKNICKLLQNIKEKRRIVFPQLGQRCFKSLKCCVWVHYLCKCAFHRWSCRTKAIRGKETCSASCPTGVSHAVLVGDIFLIAGFTTAHHAQ